MYCRNIFQKLYPIALHGRIVNQTGKPMLEFKWFTGRKKPSSLCSLIAQPQETGGKETQKTLGSHCLFIDKTEKSLRDV